MKSRAARWEACWPASAEPDIRRAAPRSNACLPGCATAPGAARAPWAAASLDSGTTACTSAANLRAVRERLALAPGGVALWDGRFAVKLGRSGSGVSRCARPRSRAASLEVRAMGAAGWRALRNTEAAAPGRALPGAARLALPALWDLEGVCSVPHLNFWRPGFPAVPALALDAVFRPRRPLCPLPFAAVPAGWATNDRDKHG